MIKFYVDKNVSFLRLIDNLSVWDIHTRPYIKEWYEKEYSLSKKDLQVLKQYSKIRKKYGWRKFDSVFAQTKNTEEAFKILERTLPIQEIKQLKTIFLNFEDKFNQIWHFWQSYLEKRKHNLQKIIKKIKFMQAAKEIARFFNFPLQKSFTCHMHLIGSYVPKHGGGSATVKPLPHIFSEPLNILESREKDLLRDLTICLHEIAHLFIGKEMMTCLKSKQMEAVVRSLAPFGYIALKYSFITKEKQQKELKKDTLLKLDLYELTKSYIENKKSVDEIYLKKVKDIMA